MQSAATHFVGDLAANILHPSSFSRLTDTTAATSGKSPFGMPTQKMELFVDSDCQGYGQPVRVAGRGTEGKGQG